jgi:hypothetical protein
MGQLAKVAVQNKVAVYWNVRNACKFRGYNKEHW